MKLIIIIIIIEEHRRGAPIKIKSNSYLVRSSQQSGIRRLERHQRRIIISASRWVLNCELHELAAPAIARGILQNILGALSRLTVAGKPPAGAKSFRSFQRAPATNRQRLVKHLIRRIADARSASLRRYDSFQVAFQYFSLLNSQQAQLHFGRQSLLKSVRLTS